MKRMRVLLLYFMAVFMLLTSPSVTSAAPIMYWYNYINNLDQYRMVFTYPSDTASYTLDFHTPSGTYYNLEFDVKPTGLFYLTCNGTYEMKFYDANGDITGWFDPFVTSRIEQPSCQSYTGQDGKKDFNVESTITPDGKQQLNWADVNMDYMYDVYKDGDLVGDKLTTSTYTGDPGSYVVIKRSIQDGSVVGWTDIAGTGDPSTGTGGTGDDGSGGGGTDPPGEDCSEQICLCISKLETILQSIDQKTDHVISGLADNVAATGEVKAAVDRVKESVDGVKQAVNDLHDEFKTDVVYLVKDASDYPEPNLDEDKPQMHDEPFIDNNTYFEDQGDAEEPPAFPVAPEPVTQWDTGNGLEKVTVEPVMTSEPVLTQEPEMTVEPTMSMQPTPVKDDDMEMEPVPEQDDTFYPLRWDSSQY